MAKPPPPPPLPSTAPRKMATPPPPPPPKPTTNPYLLQRVTLKVLMRPAGTGERSWNRPLHIAELLRATDTVPEVLYEIATQGQTEIDISSVTLEVENGIRTKSKTWTGGPLATLLRSPLTMASLVKLVQSSL